LTKNSYYLFSAADLAVHGRAHQAAQLLTEMFFVDSDASDAGASKTHAHVAM